MPESKPEKEHSWVTQMQPGPLQGHALFLPREGWGAGTRAIRQPNTDREDEWTGCLSVHCPSEVPRPPSAGDFINSMATQERALAQSGE